MYWQNLEIIREYVTATCTAVWNLEATASLGTRWLNAAVIASELFSSLKIHRKMLISDVLISFKSKLLVVNVVESWNAGKMA